MKISLFKNVSEVKNPEILDLIDYLNDTKYGKWQDLVTACRTIKDDDEKKAFKKKMPTATLSGTFTYRDDASIVAHSEILAMDLDDVDNLSELMSTLKQDKYTFSVFMSTGGYGLRWLIRIKKSKHKEAFKGAMQYLFEAYGITADPNSSISKPYIVSFDPDLYLSPSWPDHLVFEKYVKETVIKSIPTFIHNEEDFQNVYRQVIGRRINLCENYDDWLKIGFGLAEEFGEGGRSFFHELSSMSEKYVFTKCDKQFTACLRARGLNGKINIRTFYYLAKSAGVNITSEKTKDIVRMTKNGKRAGLKPKQILENLKEKGGISASDEFIDRIYNSEDKDNFSDEDDSTIHVLEMFIKNNYDLRLNEISGFFENGNTIINQNIMNSIYIAAKKVLPKLDYNLMIRLLKSDFIHTYNPFFEFFKSDGIPVVLPHQPDESKTFESPAIDKLASSIINNDDAYTLFFLRKWLVSIISAAHKVHSPLLLCLTGPQNTGKTEFFRRLMPSELRHYYAESKLDKEKDDEILMCEKLIIMDDELGGKSKRDTLKLNNLTSRQHFYLRRPYADANEEMLRLAVLCGTSNYSALLADPTGNRRIIPTFVKDIDKEIYNFVNKKDLFLEMYRLYKTGFDWRITHKDLKLLNKDQETYSIVIKERELLMKYYEPQDDIQSADKMTNTDILIELEQMTGQKLDTRAITRELEELGFKKKTVRYGQFNSRVGSFWILRKVGREPNRPLPF